MLDGYANARTVSNSYVGYMAALLCRYPRQVALACVAPDGVPSLTKFIPTPADVIGFCESRVRPMHEEAEREKRVDEQLRARDEWLNEARSPHEQERRMALAKAWLERNDSRAAELSGDKPFTEEDREALAADAKKAGAKISQMKLRKETLDAMREKDKLREHTTADLT